MEYSGELSRSLKDDWKTFDSLAWVTLNNAFAAFSHFWFNQFPGAFLERVHVQINCPIIPASSCSRM